MGDKQEHHDGERPHWTYSGEHGPKNWPMHFHDPDPSNPFDAKNIHSCGGNRQSPIDIDYSTTKAVQLPKIIWNNTYGEVPEITTIVNNGHTVNVKPRFHKRYATIKGGPLDSTYVLDHVHFHWGETDDIGSEHTVNGKAYPMEMHAVHILEDPETNKPNKIEYAKDQENGLAVVGYFFEVMHRYHLQLEDKPNTAMTCIEEMFDRIQTVYAPKPTRKAETDEKPNDDDLDTNMPQVLHEFFICELAEPFFTGYVTYKGSLTTPPCSESVTWILCPHTIKISKQQMQKFRNLCKTTPGLLNNFRPTQPLNDREVLFVSTIIERNLLEEENPTPLCDPKRPNIFVDRNNLLGKNTEASKAHPHLHFSYGSGPTGASHWSKLFKQCGGKHQSPIDINLSALKTIHMSKISWDCIYGQIPEMTTVANNGHTVVIKPKFANGKVATIQGGPLATPYVLDHLHFHWGTNDHKGSEHTINGKSYPMEMHAVHIKEHLNLEQAAKLPDGLAVVGYIFEIENTCHKAIKYIQEAFELIELDVDTAQPLQNMFAINELAEPFCTGFVTYKGSLTTPPCSESVIWIVSPYTIGISVNQMKRFRSLYDSSKGLINNFRPTQPLNDRVVHFVT